MRVPRKIEDFSGCIKGIGLKDNIDGGGGGIRTHGPQKGTAVFKTASLDHSDTPPCYFLKLF